MARVHQVIQLHVEAPPKPPAGQPCNGCGVCCASVPCPAGMLFSRRRSGRCSALLWLDGESLYRCGLVAQPARFLPRLLRPLSPLLARWARRAISAGPGCDSDLVPQPQP